LENPWDLGAKLKKKKFGRPNKKVKSKFLVFFFFFSWKASGLGERWGKSPQAPKWLRPWVQDFTSHKTNLRGGGSRFLLHSLSLSTPRSYSLPLILVFSFVYWCSPTRLVILAYSLCIRPSTSVLYRSSAPCTLLLFAVVFLLWIRVFFLFDLSKVSQIWGLSFIAWIFRCKGLSFMVDLNIYIFKNI